MLTGVSTWAQTSAFSPVAAGAENKPLEYVLQRGDDLSVRVYNLTQLDGDFRIRPDGFISVVLLNDVQAAGLTPSALGKLLSEGYAQHFKTPRVTVIVRSFASQNVFVGGEVAVPASIPIRGNIGAVQAVVSAGGIKEAGADEVLIVRTGEDGAPRRETVSIREVLAGNRTDPVLKASDTVYVQKATINVYVGGEVGHPGMIPLGGGLSIMAAVFQAGGFRPSAKTDAVVLVRDSGKGAPVITKISLKDVFQDSPHTRLQPFDVIVVPRTRISKLNQWVDQYIRQMSPATLSIGFSYLLGNSFGTSSTPSSPFF